MFLQILKIFMNENDFFYNTHSIYSQNIQKKNHNRNLPKNVSL